MIPSLEQYKKKKPVFYHPVYMYPITKKQAASEALIHGNIYCSQKFTKEQVKKMFPEIKL